jgi:glyoxylase-like metal-dependent hydrolase (beta-lactamase superfamily II)
MDYSVISIGTLSKNPLWNERLPVRTSHATSSLIATGDQRILVDPSLPPQILEARLFERTGLKPDAITQVFLTNWRPVHRRALELFPKATWYLHSAEIQAAGEVLEAAAERADRTGEENDAIIKQELDLLKRIQEAPDELADGVDLFPLFGYTPGQCGLLVSLPTSTILIAGDAVPTAGHFSAGQVFQESWDIEKAKESLAEMYEIADVVIPGHDNMFINPRVAGM